MRVSPYRIDVPQAALDDLRRRLDATRWPDHLDGWGWEFGTDYRSLRAAVDRWTGGYDWRGHEATLNRYPQVLGEAGGARVHAINARSREANAFPIVLIHGWPSCVSEFVKVIDPLIDPVAHGGEATDAFDVLAVSLPGFGFSGPTPSRGWHGPRMAALIVELCQALGFERYGVYGGDAGANVAEHIGIIDSGRVAGVHLQLGGVRIAGIARSKPEWIADATDFEREAVAALERYERFDSGYNLLNTTRPHTLSYALHDSPVGQAAWIIEKFNNWTDCDGPEGRDFTRAVDLDDVLNVVSTYWFTGTAASAARFYAETVPVVAAGATPPLTVPTGCALFPGDIVRAPRRWAERIYPNIVHWTDMPRGGHFGCLEEPDLFVADVRSFFRSLR